MSGAPRILLLNLDHTTVDVLTRWLCRDGLSAHSVADAVPKLALLREHPYDVLVAFASDMGFVAVMRASLPRSQQPWVIILGHTSELRPQDHDIIDTYLRFPVPGKQLMVPVRWALSVRPRLREHAASERSPGE